MTDIFISARRGAGAPAEILFGTVTFKPTLAHSRSTSIVLPAPTTFDLVDGEVVATNVQPTPEPVEGKIEWAYEVTFKDRHSKSYSFLVGVPDSTSQVNFIDLPRYFETKPPLFGKGPKGEPGEAATVEVGAVESGDTPSITNSGTSQDAILNFVLPKGDKGDTGAPGPQGDTGPRGSDGTSVTIKGSVATASNLPTTGNTVGDGWITDNDGHLHVWSGSAFSDVGEIRGPQGEPGDTGPQGPPGLNSTYLGFRARLFSDPPSAYPEGLSVFRGTQSDGWPSTVGVTTSYAGAPGTGYQEIKDYSTNKPIAIRRATPGTADTWEEIDTSSTVNPKDFGALGDGVTNDSVAFQQAVTYASEQGKLLVVTTGTYILPSTIMVPGALEVVGEGSPELVGKNNANILRTNYPIKVQGVTFRGSQGASPATKSNQTGIYVGGEWSSFVESVTVENCKFIELEGYGLLLRFATNFSICNNEFIRTGYCGFAGSSVRSGTYTNNIIYGTGFLPSFAPNSYGMTLSLPGGAEVTEENPLPRSVVIANNVCENQAWEAFDTHGGTDIIFDSNTIKDSEVGIAVTQKEGTSETAPKRIVVTNNVIDAGSYPQDKVRTGIVVNGSSSSGLCEAIITNNVVKGFGVSVNHPAQASSWGGGVKINRCSSVIVSNNQIQDSLGAAISLRAFGTAIVSSNHLDTVWREAADTSRVSSAVKLTGGVFGSLTMQGNTLTNNFARSNSNERIIEAEPASQGYLADLGNHFGNVRSDRISSPVRGGWNESLYLGGEGPVDGVPKQPVTVTTVKSNAPPSEYPWGVSHRNATATGTNLWPFAGLLITYRYSQRSVQELFSYSGSSVRRAWRTEVPTNAWSEWQETVTDIDSRTDMYDIALSGADMTGTLDSGALISAWLPSLPSGSTVFSEKGATIYIATEVAVANELKFTDLDVRTGSNGIAFQVTANNVQFRNCRFTGVGTATYRANRPILRFSGTDLNNRIENGLVEDCVFRNLQDGALTYRFARNCHATRLDIENFCYVGVMFSSVDTHSVTHSRIGGAVQRTNVNSYAIASTDNLNTIEARSKDGYFAYNEIFDIPLWEGIDTHGGLRMTVIGNTFRGVRRAICMLQGNTDRVTGAQEITIIGNTIDGSGTGTATTGITLAGTTDLSMLASGTIVGNSVLNCTTPAVISRVDWNKTAVVGNTGIGDGHDQGWQTFEQDSFMAGWFSNTTYPVRYRYSRGNGKTTVEIEGVLSRTTGLNTNLIQLPDVLYPGTSKIIGPTSTTTQVSGLLEINSSGRLRFIFAGGTETGNLSVTCRYTF